MLSSINIEYVSLIIYLKVISILHSNIFFSGACSSLLELLELAFVQVDSQTKRNSFVGEPVATIPCSLVYLEFQRNLQRFLKMRKRFAEEVNDWIHVRSHLKILIITCILCTFLYIYRTNRWKLGIPHSFVPWLLLL